MPATSSCTSRPRQHPPTCHVIIHIPATSALKCLPRHPPHSCHVSLQLPATASSTCLSRHHPHACHVILHIVDPRFLREMESHDVACIICQALQCGGFVDGAQLCVSSIGAGAHAQINTRPSSSRRPSVLDDSKVAGAG